jgi:hypothetical protein
MAKERGWWMMKRMADCERVVKTADDGLFFVAKEYWHLFFMCCLFTRTFYRIFVL